MVLKEFVVKKNSDNEGIKSICVLLVMYGIVLEIIIL